MSALLDLVGLTQLCEFSQGIPEIAVALVDGPVATAEGASAKASIRVLGRSAGTGSNGASAACTHGTAVAAILVGARSSPAPAIAPGCTLLVRPIFSENSQGPMPSATAGELAKAIRECVAAGARIINLSIAVMEASGAARKALEDALDAANARGLLIVAAAGNQGILGTSPLTRHPAVLPVAACDATGRATNETNLARSIAERGLLAPGVGVTTVASDGKPATIGGTSAAVPFVSGAAALLWSLFPRANAADLRRALVGAGPRPLRLIPPLLDAWSAYQRLLQRKDEFMSEHVIQTDTPAGAPLSPLIARATTAGAVQSAACCANCGAKTGGAADLAVTPVYAIGSIEARFPTPGIEKEYLQVVARGEVKGKPDRQTFAETLGLPHNRYLARKLCWIFSVEGLPTYLLQPNEPTGIEALIAAIRPTPRPTDIDVIIGWRGPIAPAEMCNGLQVPIVVFDQLYSFPMDTLIQSAVTGSQGKLDITHSAEELFHRIQQMADNAGNTDEHRALNYLAVRCDAIYKHAADASARNQSLTAVETRVSPLSGGGTRRVLDVIFQFTHRTTDVSERHFLRVDVTEEFPFLVSKLAPYYDR